MIYFQEADSNSLGVWERLSAVAVYCAFCMIFWYRLMQLLQYIFAKFHGQLERDNGVFSSVYETQLRRAGTPPNWLLRIFCSESVCMTTGCSATPAQQPQSEWMEPFTLQINIDFWIRWVHYVCACTTISLHTPCMHTYTYLYIYIYLIVIVWHIHYMYIYIYKLFTYI